MLAVLNLEPDLRDHLWAHLLPARASHEQAAFLFCVPAPRRGRIEFDVVDTTLLLSSDFAAQEDDYLELTDAARISLIKRGHALGASLVEMHSHPAPWPAAFSRADRRGLLETVPHMRWRLKQRPYIAIVVAPCGFDALVWWQGQLIPEPLQGIQVGSTLLVPTNKSLEGWDDDELL